MGNGRPVEPFPAPHPAALPPAAFSPGRPEYPATLTVPGAPDAREHPADPRARAPLQSADLLAVAPKTA